MSNSDEDSGLKFRGKVRQSKDKWKKSYPSDPSEEDSQVPIIDLKIDLKDNNAKLINDHPVESDQDVGLCQR